MDTGKEKDKVRSSGTLSAEVCQAVEPEPMGVRFEDRDEGNNMCTEDLIEC